MESCDVMSSVTSEQWFCHTHTQTHTETLLCIYLGYKTWINYDHTRGKCVTAVLQLSHGREQCEQCRFIRKGMPLKAIMCSQLAEYHRRGEGWMIGLYFTPKDTLSLPSRQIKVKALIILCVSQYSLMNNHSFWCGPCKHFIILPRLIIFNHMTKYFF